MLLRRLGLTAAQFADTIGIQRSSVSHVISGRNKPSMDFVEKILAAYPQVNLEWLILGKGGMLKGADLFSQMEPEAASAPTSLKSVNDPSMAPDLSETKKTVSAAEVQPKEKPVPGRGKDEKLERIVLFYQDGRFREYLP